MDSDFWTMRLAAAKRQFNLQNLSRNRPMSQLDRFHAEDFDEEQELPPPDFSCPYCGEDYDIASLCSHLVTDHPYESKSTEALACPVCSLKVLGDMLAHIAVQHRHLFKVQRRGRRVPAPSSQALSVLGRDLREAHLQGLLGGSGWFRSNTDNNPPPLASTFPASELDDISKSLMLSLEENNVPQHMWKSSSLSPLSEEEQEQRIKQVAGRAVFVQDLLVSTLLTE